MESAAGSSARHGKIGVWLLAAGQTFVWVGLYYAFAALLLTWEESLGWSKADLTLGLTVAVLVSALVSPLAGRIIDAGRGRALLGLGALGGSAALVALSQVETPMAFVLVWGLIGFAQGACLYEPCFAYVTRTTGATARFAITRITLVAGFASPIAFTLGAVSAEALGWRGAVLIFAAAVGCLGAPLLLVGGTLLERGGPAAPPGGRDQRRSENRAALRRAVRRPQFWLIAVAFPLMAINHGMLLNHIIPLLVERGLGTALAVSVASVIGPMQVAGRVAMMLVERKVGAVALTALSFAGVVAAALILMAASGSPLLAFAFAATQGAAYGLISVLKPVVTAEFLGLTAFGTIAGWLAAPYLAGFAFAPHLGSLVWEVGGYDLMVPVAAALAAVGLLCVALLAVSRLGRHDATRGLERPGRIR